MGQRLTVAVLLAFTLALPALAQGERLILAHRMIGFGPHFQRNEQEGPYGFLFPTKAPAGPDTTGWCREGHLGALHPAFPSRLEELKWEIQQAQAAGVEGFILDTCGYDRGGDRPTCDAMIEAAAALGGTFKVGLCLDYGWGGNELKVDSVREWLARHRNNPSLLRVRGLPAFVTYGSGYRSPEEVATMFKALREAAGEPIYLMTDLTE
ncbi:MAG: endo-1,3-alpha-glucanase family glycosylhydrolase, partial [Armatimonadota bacterium]